MALQKVIRNMLDTGVSDSSDATAITINSSENVGIGDTSPSAIRLSVVTPTANHVGLQVENSNTADSFGMIVKGGNDANDYTADFRKRDNTSIMRILGSGNVGIGTTSPQGDLHIYDDSASARIYITSGNSDDSSIYFGRINDTATAAIRYCLLYTSDAADE